VWTFYKGLVEAETSIHKAARELQKQLKKEALKQKKLFDDAEAAEAAAGNSQPKASADD
jgi:hypothetical protein